MVVGVSIVTAVQACRVKMFRCFLAKFSSWVLFSIVSFSLKILPVKTDFLSRLFF